MAIWRTADHTGLGGFTGGTSPAGTLGGGDVTGRVNIIDAGSPIGGGGAMGSGGTMAGGNTMAGGGPMDRGGPMDMQGFMGMLMQLVRRYQGGGGMQPGRFPQSGEQMMPTQMPMQGEMQAPRRLDAFGQGTGEVYTPQSPMDWQQYSRRQTLSPLRPQKQPLGGAAPAPQMMTDSMTQMV